MEPALLFCIGAMLWSGLRRPSVFEPWYLAPRHQPPEQQRTDAQPDEVQCEDLNVAGNRW